MSQKRALPPGYSLGNDGRTQNGILKITVLRDGKPCEFSYFEGPDKPQQNWHMEEKGATKLAWGDYNEQQTNKINDKRKKEEYHVVAWRTGNGDIYSIGHITFPHTLDQLEEITMFTHWQEANEMLYQHCGAVAIDQEILDEWELGNDY